MADELKNGLTEALLGFGLPNQNGQGVQLSQTATLFRNMRWYLVSNMRQPLSQAYVEIGLIQAIVNIPVDDALRGGVEVNSKQLSGEQLEVLAARIEKQEVVTGSANQAGRWNRLFGGAGIVINTDQNPIEPLKIDTLKQGDRVEFIPCDMWELFYNKQAYDGLSFGNQQAVFKNYDYYGVNFDKSRVLDMRGIEAPSLIRPRLRGWGCSVVEILIRSINQYLKANDLIFEVLDEFKIDVYRLQSLASTMMEAGGENRVQNRIQRMNLLKNYQNAIVMDKEDEFSQKELTFTGIAETMDGIKKYISSEMRIPMSKLFGIGSQGFSSGEDDIENYNAMVEGQVRTKIKYPILKMVEILCQVEFGFVPSDLKIEFKPLRVLSSEQEESVKNAKFARNFQAFQGKAISLKTFLEGCNKDKLLSVQVDPEEEELALPEETDQEDAGTEAAAAPKSSLEAPEAKT